MKNFNEVIKEIKQAVREPQAVQGYDINIADMKYLGSILNIVRKYNDAKCKLDEYHRDRIGNIKNVYGEYGNKYKELSDIAKKERSEVLQELRLEGKKLCKQEFEKIDKMIEEHVLETMPTELQAQVEYLEKHANKLSDSERIIIAKHCKRNHKALMAVKQYLPQSYVVQTYDDIKDELTTLKKMVYDVVSNAGTEYMYNLTLHGSYICSVDYNIQDFLGANFE